MMHGGTEKINCRKEMGDKADWRIKKKKFYLLLIGWFLLFFKKKKKIKATLICVELKLKSSKQQRNNIWRTLTWPFPLHLSLAHTSGFASLPFKPCVLIVWYLSSVMSNPRRGSSIKAKKVPQRERHMLWDYRAKPGGNARLISGQRQVCAEHGKQSISMIAV